MKIVAVLESQIVGGGAFNQALNAILQMHRICEGRFEFEVYSLYAKNLTELDKIGIDAHWVKVSIIDKVLAYLNKMSWWRPIQNRLKLIGPFEKTLIRNKCDLAYFLTQSSTMEFLQKTNFITTVFDLCHRDNPEFPEVTDFGIFDARESHFKHNLAQALIIVTESDALSDKVARRYGVDRERCVAVPMSASAFLQDEISHDISDVLEKYELSEGYFFYPAQFWSHKNHIRILEALVELRNDGISSSAVFVGADKGNLGHIQKSMRQHGLEEQVKILGFVPAEDMRGLYEACIAVVMPTYFGPTNIPPLESWLTRKPLIYSSHLQEHSGDAAIGVDPDDARALADAMRLCIEDRSLVETLVANGITRLQQIEALRAIAERELTERLHQYQIRRSCWG